MPSKRELDNGTARMPRTLEAKKAPDCDTLTGRFVALERIDEARHAAGFERHLCGPSNASLWDYIPFGPPSDAARLMGVLRGTEESLGWIAFAIRDLASDEVTGTLSLMRVRPEHGSAEVGCVVFGQKLQRTRAATEAVYLLARHLFDTHRHDCQRREPRHRLVRHDRRGLGEA